MVNFLTLKTIIMNNQKWKGRWKEIKGKVKKSYGNLTDDDLIYEEGREEELLGRLQKKTGQSREEVNEWLNSL